MVKNYLAAIELSSLYINVVIGSYRNGSFDIVAASRTRCQGYRYGEVLDEGLLGESITNARNSIKSRYKIDFDETLLVLPCINHHVYKAEAGRDVETSGRIVSTKEINLLINRIKKAQVGVNETLIDAVPTSYVLDENREFRTAPLNYKSSTLGIVCNVHTVPTDIVNKLEKVLKDNGISVIGKVLDVSSGAFVNSKPYFLEEESVCINIGYDVTTISCYLKSNLISCGYVDFGVSTLIGYLANNLNVTFDDAIRLFESYFIADATLASDIIFEEERKISEKRICEIVLTRLNTAFKEIIDKLVYLTHSNQLKFEDDFKILISGSLNDYEGFVKLFEEFAGNNIVEGGVSIPTLKYQSYNNCLGAIKMFNSRNPNFMESRMQDDVTIENEVKKEVPSESRQPEDGKEVKKGNRFSDFFDD